MGELLSPSPEEQNKPEKESVPIALFDMGQVVITVGAAQSLAIVKRHPTQLLALHVTGNWGDLPEADIEENERSLKQGFRLFSSYTIDDAKFYVITEWDRSVTTVLLPSEY